MILGGIPYYLSLLRPAESLPQNIDRLFFADDAEMHREYKRLFKSLFRNPEPYQLILEQLAKKKSGMDRDEVAKALKLTSGGGLSDKLDNLIYCDFIRRYYVKDKKVKSTSAIYQMTDFFTFFYLTFCLAPSTNPNFWSSTTDKPVQNNWFGLAYERLCMAHIPQIKNALHIDSIQTSFYSWRSKQSTPAVQIDLIIERADQVVNVCEVKYSQREYAIDKDEDLRLRNRCGSFKEETKTRAAIHPVLITTFGMKRNMYSDYITAEVTMDDLFQ
ncbi:MAG: ATP-binding protein, partial [Bacteroidales bacterium]|nr:ATP-binding protein [Bacteroidales bacterium]